MGHGALVALSREATSSDRYVVPQEEQLEFVIIFT